MKDDIKQVQKTVGVEMLKILSTRELADVLIDLIELTVDNFKLVATTTYKNGLYNGTNYNIKRKK
jgi:hypothetical protein